MAYKKGYKKGFRKFKKKGYRRFKKARIPKGMSTKTHMTKVTFKSFSNTDTMANYFNNMASFYFVARNLTTTGPNTCICPSFSDIPGYQNYFKLFKKYKICGVKAKWIFPATAFFPTDNAVGYELHTIYNDVNTEKCQTQYGSLNQFTEDATYKRFVPNANKREYSRYFRPKIAQVVLSNQNSDPPTSQWSYNPVPSKWMISDDITESGILHRGLNFAVSTYSSGLTDISYAIPGDLEVYITLYLAFREARNTG